MSSWRESLGASPWGSMKKAEVAEKEERWGDAAEWWRIAAKWYDGSNPEYAEKAKRRQTLCEERSAE